MDMSSGNHKSEWENSYANRDNYLFHPHEEVIRFVSKYIRKRIGLDQFSDVASSAGPRRVLDLGCGIGRHVMYCHDMGLEAYGVDLSESAIGAAVEWAASRGTKEVIPRVVAADARHLPWVDGFFQYAVSHGVLDSMPFALARTISADLARSMAPQGLFYCDLISGDDSRHAREFSGEEIVQGAHETGTVQLYFNLALIRTLFDGLFEIVECNLIRREEVLLGGHIARYHLVLRKI
jgi:SAM-dependent methyltransferase